jgi:hypothetical protein
MGYTKGEWEAVRAFNKGWFVGNGNISIAHDIKSPDDAHLISAAPDMYEALKNYIELLDTLIFQHPDDVILAARMMEAVKARAKAEGK